MPMMTQRLLVRWLAGLATIIVSWSCIRIDGACCMRLMGGRCTLFTGAAEIRTECLVAGRDEGQAENWLTFMNNMNEFQKSFRVEVFTTRSPSCLMLLILV